MISVLSDVLASMMSLAYLKMMLLGVSVGLVVGVLPGLGGSVGMSIMLPFIFGMDPTLALPMLIGMTAVIHTADTFPSVLLGVPGSSGSQATIMDGYPLAKDGQAARALSSAFVASMVGGIFGAITLFIILPFAEPIVLSFGSPEVLMLAILGLSMVGILSGADPLMGIVVACVGLLIGAIGAAPAIAHYRYTFDLIYLWDGVPIAVLALGLFALPELIDMLVDQTSISRKDLKLGKGWLQGIRDVVTHRWIVLRSSAIGVAVGMLPGLGGSVVDWISYGNVVQTSRDKSRFGKGDIRGVIAPESSNNAKEGGALVPTLLFGIPGSGTNAILLGGFILIGIDPGPLLITNQPDLVVLIVWTLAIANVVGGLACLSLAFPIAKLTSVSAGRLAPFLLVIMIVGAYRSTISFGDLIVFLVIGVIGCFMKWLGWPRAPLMIGYVLSTGVERNLWISVTRYGYDWLFRPGVMIIAALTLTLVLLGIYFRPRINS